MKTLFCLFLLTLTACGPSAKETAEIQAGQQAKQSFRTAIAELKICTQGATYAEFREKRLRAEASFAANEHALTNHLESIARSTIEIQMNELRPALRCTDELWKFQLDYPYAPIPKQGRARIAIDFLLPASQSTQTISANEATRIGLGQIAGFCDGLLNAVAP